MKDQVCELTTKKIRLKQGLHPVEVTFFEQGGAEKLEVPWEGPDLSTQVISKEAWFWKE